MMPHPPQEEKMYNWCKGGMCHEIHLHDAITCTACEHENSPHKEQMDWKYGCYGENPCPHGANLPEHSDIVSQERKEIISSYCELRDNVLRLLDEFDTDILQKDKKG